jgi:hypothetical protein
MDSDDTRFGGGGGTDIRYLSSNRTGSLIRLN